MKAFVVIIVAALVAASAAHAITSVKASSTHHISRLQAAEDAANH